MHKRGPIQLGKLSMWSVPYKLPQGTREGKNISLHVAPIVDSTSGMGVS